MPIETCIPTGFVTEAHYDELHAYYEEVQSYGKNDLQPLPVVPTDSTNYNKDNEIVYVEQEETPI